MKDVMLDFETFGNGKRACIVQIGAAYFDRTTGEVGKTFKRNVDARSSVQSGGEIDPDTVYWWLSQDKAAQTAITSGELHPLRTAMLELNQFLQHAEAVWSHATFDFVILQETLKMLYIPPSFPYRAARDIRTLVDMAGVRTKKGRVREGVHHDALDDCIFQVAYCVEAMRKLEITEQSPKN